MRLSKAHRLIGVASRGTVEIRFDERFFRSMFAEALDHFQQQDARKAKPMKAWMDANWLDLGDAPRWIKPANAESGQPSIRSSDYQIKIGSILWHQKRSSTPFGHHRRGLEGGAMQFGVGVGFLFAAQTAERKTSRQRGNGHQGSEWMLQQDVASVIIVQQESMRLGEM